MKTVFVIRNQNGHYLGRHGEWLDGSHVPGLFRTEHRDVAVNELVEVNLRDFDLRGEVVGIEGVEGDYPVVEVTNPIVDTPVKEATEAAAAAETEDAQQVSEA
ncbi:MAG: heat-shock protein HtpX [Gammaproteobacteria bacterium]